MSLKNDERIYEIQRQDWIKNKSKELLKKAGYKEETSEEKIKIKNHQTAYFYCIILVSFYVLIKYFH